jgi:hypothetical protein
VCIVLDVSRKELLEEIEDFTKLMRKAGTAQQIKIATKKTWRRKYGEMNITVTLPSDTVNGLS